MYDQMNISDNDRHDHADDRRDVRPQSLDRDVEPLRQRVGFQFVAMCRFHFWLVRLNSSTRQTSSEV